MRPATRHFAVIEGRQVFYRRIGEGPAVFVLHGSPQASRAVAGVAEACAARGLCAISPDTPGAGRSDPLPGERPTSADYARHLRGLAEVLGVRRAGIYGFHTGAATACAFAGLFPERTAAVALEGLPAWSEAERTDFTANYLPDFTPRWDGSHMAWLWARMEEQSVFFPWHAPWPEARMGYAVSPAAGVHANAMDLLDAGNAYRAVYQAAFDFRPEDWLDRLKAPALICTTEFDVLREHLDRPPLAGRGQGFPTLAAIQAACAEHLATHPGEAATSAPSLTHRGFVDVGGETLAWRGDPDGPLVLHAAGGRLDDLTDAGLRLDLPGHGDSAEGWTDAPTTLADWTEAVRAATSALGVPMRGVTGCGIGGRIAEALGGVSTGPGYGPPPPVEFGSVSLKPEWDGAHLLRAWRIARWERLFAPWHERVPARALKPFSDLDPASVHSRTVSLLKAHDRWLAAARLETSVS